VSSSRHAGQSDHEKSAADHDGLHATMDRRSQRTRRALHEALIRLIERRDYDEISVMDVTEEANVGRSTFYAHFVDKDDLLRSGTEHFRAMLLQSAAANEDRDGPLAFGLFMIEHLRERQDLYRALMQGRAGPIIMDRFRDYIAELVRAELVPARAKRQDAFKSELQVQFVVGAFMSVLTWWIERGARESPRVVNDAFAKLVNHGLQGAEATARDHQEA
jgi:AcrR family transcriptional regulator